MWVGIGNPKKNKKKTEYSITTATTLNPTLLNPTLLNPNRHGEPPGLCYRSERNELLPVGHPVCGGCCLGSALPALAAGGHLPEPGRDTLH
ncbi:hypothetical protein NHX12_033095 [Muraenolepis orangiensis]|uniref:Uncharacterized protein n=1 Tax=Muraenolepis orangiensis TaxID=630683 RepID=A0A9Q0E6Y8_9TELE|nr:hypothetical protein NHX12_033095 [Muraenolepis orangiensis]